MHVYEAQLWWNVVLGEVMDGKVVPQRGKGGEAWVSEVLITIAPSNQREVIKWLYL